MEKQSGNWGFVAIEISREILPMKQYWYDVDTTKLIPLIRLVGHKTTGISADELRLISELLLTFHPRFICYLHFHLLKAYLIHTHT